MSFHRIHCISHHFTLYFTHFIVHITCIARISRMSRILRYTHIAHFMHCTTYHVILCIISCHFIMKIHFILVHAISHWREKKKGQNAKLFNRAPPEWNVLIRTIKMPPDWGVFTNDKNATSSKSFISRVQFHLRVPFLTKNSSCTSSNSYPRVVQDLLRDPKLLEKSWKPF